MNHPWLPTDCKFHHHWMGFGWDLDGVWSKLFGWDLDGVWSKLFGWGLDGVWMEFSGVTSSPPQQPNIPITHVVQLIFASLR
jgi:hypothetical protein